MVCFARLKNHCFNGVYLLTKFVAVGGVRCGGMCVLRWGACVAVGCVCCGGACVLRWDVCAAVGCVISAALPDKLMAWRRGKGNHKKDDI